MKEQLKKAWRKVWRKEKFIFCFPISYGTRSLIVVDIFWASFIFMEYIMFIILEQSTFIQFFDIFSIIRVSFDIKNPEQLEHIHKLV